MALKKAVKKSKKLIKKTKKKGWTWFFSEMIDEIMDFSAALGEAFFDKKQNKHMLREAVIGGKIRYVRPAVIFAERIDHIIKVVIGVSIIVSAGLAVKWGFPRLGDLLDYLIGTLAGRCILLFIGLSYLILGVWKLARRRL